MSNIEKNASQLSFNIAGLQYYIPFKKEECGTFDGYLKAEPTNKYDPNAVKICKKDGTMVGHVPRNQAPIMGMLIGMQRWKCIIKIFEPYWAKEDDEDSEYGPYLDAKCYVDGLPLTEEVEHNFYSPNNDYDLEAIRQKAFPRKEKITAVPKNTTISPNFDFKEVITKYISPLIKKLKQINLHKNKSYDGSCYNKSEK